MKSKNYLSFRHLRALNVSLLLSAFVLGTNAFAGAIPANWVSSQLLELNACGRFFKMVSSATGSVNHQATENLAKLAFLDKDKESVAVNVLTRPMVLEVGAYSLHPVLANKTEDLSYEILKNGQLRVTLKSDFWKSGKTEASVTFSSETLKFLAENRDPDMADRRALDEINNEALKAFSNARLEKVRSIYEGVAKQVQITAIEKTISTDGIPVLKIKYVTNQNKEYQLWIGFLESTMSHIVFPTQNPSAYRTGVKIYQHFEMFMNGFTFGDSITRSYLGVIKTKTEDFSLDKILDNSPLAYTYDTPPKWATQTGFSKSSP